MGTNQLRERLLYERHNPQVPLHGGMAAATAWTPPNEHNRLRDLIKIYHELGDGRYDDYQLIILWKYCAFRKYGTTRDFMGMNYKLVLLRNWLNEHPLLGRSMALIIIQLVATLISAADNLTLRHIRELTDRYEPIQTRVERNLLRIIRRDIIYIAKLRLLELIRR